MDSLQGKRILIVEDNVTNMAVFATTLKRQGVVVLQDGLNINPVDTVLKFLPIDLIVMDIMLRHGVNGYEVFDQIKSHPQLAHIPVVAVSSLDPEQEIPKAKARGFAGFISKPIRAIDFARHLADCINGGQAWVISQ